MNTKRRFLYLLAGPIIFIVVTLFLAQIFKNTSAEAIGVLVWMIFWWITRPIHMTITALLPIVVNAVFNIVPMGSVTSQYFSDSIILILGACFLTIPWKTTGLDRRVALRILSLVGPSIKSQIIVWLLASTILSTMIPNVAVCALLCPIAVAMLNAAGYEDIKAAKPSVPILLSIGWGAGLGGAGSPLGGAMNIAAISYLEEYTGREFMYVDWVVRMAPFFIISTAITFVYMQFISKGAEPIKGTVEYFDKSYKELGPIKRDEKICGMLFIIAFIGAFSRPLFAELLPALAPAYILLIFGCVSFVITAVDKGPILTWEAAEDGTMWGMMILFGGGLALGKLVNESGASVDIANIVSGMSLDGGFFTVVLLTVFAVILSESTNSTVSAAVTVPIVLSFTSELGLNPIPYWFITIMAFNAEFLLPVSVRAIPVSYGLDPDQMLKKGIPIVLIRMVVVIILGYTLMKFWPTFSDIPYLMQ